MTWQQAKELGLKRFFNGLPCKNGHIAERWVKRSDSDSSHGHCLECQKISMRKSKDKNPNIYKNIQKRYKRKDPVRDLIRGAKAMSKQRGLKFTITRDDIELTKFCPCCDKEMIVKYEGRQTDDTPTLDRVKNDLGYIKGNVVIICWKCNQMKHKGTASEHRAIADYIDKYSPK